MVDEIGALVGFEVVKEGREDIVPLAANPIDALEFVQANELPNILDSKGMEEVTIFSQ